MLLSCLGNGTIEFGDQVRKMECPCSSLSACPGLGREERADTLSWKSDLHRPQEASSAFLDLLHTA